MYSLFQSRLLRGTTVRKYISKRNSEGETHLHLVLRMRCPDEEFIREILDLGFPVNVKNDKGQTPLHYALMYKNSETLSIVKLLVDRGADLNDPFYGLENNNCPREVIEFLVEKGPSVEKLNKYGINTSLLHKALLMHNPFVVIKVLLDKGVDVHAVNPFGISALHIAARFKRKDVIKELLKKPNINIDAVDHQGYTPLLRAITSPESDFQTVKILLEAGADIRKETNLKEQPLHLAASTCNPKVIKLLLEYKAEINCLDKHGHSPLYTAVKDSVEFNRAAIKALLDGGATVFLPSETDSPLHVALGRHNRERSANAAERIRLLLKYALIELPRLEVGMLNAYIQHLQGELEYHNPCLGQFLERSRIVGVDNCPIDVILAYLAREDYTSYREVVLGMLTRKRLKKEFQQCEVYADADAIPYRRPRLARAAKVPESFSAKVPKRKARSAKNRKRAILDYYSLRQLLKYLPDEELANLLLAFRKPPDQNMVSFDYIHEVGMHGQYRKAEASIKHIIYYSNDNESHLFPHDI